MEDKKRLSIIILSIVSAILLVGTIVFFTKFNESKKESETIAKEMEEEKKKATNGIACPHIILMTMNCVY